MKFRDFMNEAGANKYVVLGQEKSKTNELREMLKNDLGLKDELPILDSKNPESLVKEWNRKIASNGKYKKIFDFTPKGVGPGEILLASVHPDITIGGGGANYDINLGGYKLEVKAALVHKDGWFYNFRLGVDSREVLLTAVEELKELYSVAKYYIPEINNAEFRGKIARGEMTSLKKYLYNFDNKLASGYEKLDITIHKNGKIRFRDKTITSIDDKNAIEIIRDLLKSNYTKFKSYTEIEDELSSKLAAHKMSYLFFNINTTEMYYKENLTGSVIDTITGGSIKIRTPL